MDFIIGVSIVVFLIVKLISRPAAEATSGWSKEHAETTVYGYGEAVIIVAMILFVLVMAGVGANFK